MVRVTQGMLANDMLRNLSQSYTKFDTYFEQLNTGKKISRPSQDPVTAMKGINYRTQVAEVAQYQRNVTETHNWMGNTDAALDKATQVVQRLRELAVKAGNDTNAEQERNSIKEEAMQLKEHLIDIANSSVNGKYIFNGTNTADKPIDAERDSEFDFNGQSVLIEVSQGTKLKVNVNGEDVFSKESFDVVDDFIKALGNEENEEIDFNESIGALDDQVNNIIDTRAELGARMNRLELIENRLAEQEIIAKKAMSENEDVDFEEAITNLLTQESLHTAALSAGSKIIQPSLVDFLR